MNQDVARSRREAKRRARHQRIVAERSCPWCGDRSDGGLCPRCRPHEADIARIVAGAPSR